MAGRRARRGVVGPLALAIVLAGTTSCTDGQEAGATANLTSLDLSPNSRDVLSAELSVRTDEAVKVDVRAISEDHEVVLPRTSAAARSHDIPVVGLRAEHDYEIEVDLVDATGEVVGSDSTQFETGPLPEFIPEITVQAEPEGRADGYTFVELTPSARPGFEDGEDPLQVSHVVTLDGDGEVVWYFEDGGAINDVRLTDDGRVLSVYFPFGVQETDLLGRVVGDWAVAPELMPWQQTDETAGQLDQLDEQRRSDGEALPITADWVDLRSFHHEVSPMSDGNLLALSTTLHELTPEQRAQLCPGDPEEFWVISDVVVEFTRAGEVLRTWDLWDMIDVMQTPGEEMCSTTGQIATELERDWGHANAVVYDEERDAVIVSTRHTSQIVAMDHLDDLGPQSQLRWTIGTDGTVPLDGDPPRYQHAVEVESDGSLIFYDNGNKRAGTAPGTDNPPYSRAAIYRVDDSSDDSREWTATQTWEHRYDETEGKPVFAAFLGDADRLANGNVLVDHGGIPSPQPDDGDFNRCVIIEVVPEDTGGDVVRDIRIGSAERPVTCYRAEQVPSLYAGPAWE